MITPRQTAGRGRGQNGWWSGRGTLTFSIILRPSLRPADSSCAGLMSLVTGVALVRALRGIHRGVGVKWPNDLYVKNRKLGGILVESQMRQGKFSFFVVGVGLNVNTSFQKAPGPIRSSAVCLKQIARRRLDEKKVLGKILKELFNALDLFFSDGFEPFLDDWRRFDVVHPGSRISVEDAGRRLNGFYEGILPTGALCVREAGGPIRNILCGTLVVDGSKDVPR